MQREKRKKQERILLGNACHFLKESPTQHYHTCLLCTHISKKVLPIAKVFGFFQRLAIIRKQREEAAKKREEEKKGATLLQSFEI